MESGFLGRVVFLVGDSVGYHAYGASVARPHSHLQQRLSLARSGLSTGHSTTRNESKPTKKDKVNNNKNAADDDDDNDDEKINENSCNSHTQMHEQSHLMVRARG